MQPSAQALGRDQRRRASPRGAEENQNQRQRAGRPLHTQNSNQYGQCVWPSQASIIIEGGVLGWVGHNMPRLRTRAQRLHQRRLRRLTEVETVEHVAGISDLIVG